MDILLTYLGRSSAPSLSLRQGQPPWQCILLESKTLFCRRLWQPKAASYRKSQRPSTKLCGVLSPEQGCRKQGQSSETRRSRRFSRKPKTSKELVQVDPRPLLKQRISITPKEATPNYKTSLTRNGTKVSLLLIYCIRWLILTFLECGSTYTIAMDATTPQSPYSPSPSSSAHLSYWGLEWGQRVAQNGGAIPWILVLVYVDFGTCLRCLA